jgi:hypothetical protein
VRISTSVVSRSAMWPAVFVLMTMIACNRPAPRVPVGAATALSAAVVEPYLRVGAALAADSVEGVKSDAQQIGAAAQALGPPATTIEMAAGGLAAASADLRKARTQFGVLSETIDVYMAKEQLSPPAGVRAAFCPMAVRTWLQKGTTLRNPYYGSQMLTCGSFRP